ncbi:hypothetical protein Bca4012_038266 [Brassica carinata]|uniref:Uncharacterized protein n=1 Tax=Brassica carinata TaxID=52824 RepID=A0A8X8B680_BRACI|nr:hypothetical protein Bca52824_006678 [Brassica carinata]
MPSIASGNLSIPIWFSKSDSLADIAILSRKSPAGVSGSEHQGEDDCTQVASLLRQELCSMSVRLLCGFQNTCLLATQHLLSSGDNGGVSWTLLVANAVLFLLIHGSSTRFRKEH